MDGERVAAKGHKRVNRPVSESVRWKCISIGSGVAIGKIGTLVAWNKYGEQRHTHYITPHNSDHILSQKVDYFYT